MVQNLTLIGGYPASGKSTLVTERFKGYTHVNRDKAGGSVADLLPAIRDHLKSGKSVVTDNLFATKASRKDFIDAAHAAGIPCRMFILETDIEDAQVNVVMRLIKHFGHLPTEEEIKNAKHPNVFPPAVLYKYRKDYEDPQMSEGFERIERLPFKRLPWPGTEKALLLDYDGTLRDCPPSKKFPTEIADISIRHQTKAILTKFKDAGWHLLGVSNQSGVAKGDLTYDRAVELFKETNKRLGHDIDFMFCPHRIPPISCYCRKPGVGMPVAHIVKYKLDPAQCVLVGDMTTDKTCAARVGMKYEHADTFFAEGYKKYL